MEQNRIGWDQAVRGQLKWGDAHNAYIKERYNITPAKPNVWVSNLISRLWKFVSLGGFPAMNSSMERWKRNSWQRKHSKLMH